MDLQTERLKIRNWLPDQDTAAAFGIYGDERVMQWIGDRTVDPTPAATQVRLERYRQRTAADKPPGMGCWAVEELRTGQLIGNLLLVPLPNVERQPSGHIEIGWHFNPAYWGQGFATEAAQAVLKYGFETLQLAEIYVVTLPNNERSKAVAQRLGMAALGTTHQYHGGTELSLFKLTAENWQILIAEPRTVPAKMHKDSVYSDF
ncbi:GNAT family N-acetyltransferase [Pseudanabaena sp. FACHB-2040]|uniref:GNAT family N-acetyltransferase n=1 Tax=Pseudanabaena sp. FACHB-2040 TaxID=2692859 RepID=UPI00168531A9|nr:GNAT family N-acetyltransferase [Pseudanabaena sp. FACHB-2040]MBD2257834.1 GNAT family N-acetyltransferase [Pseudanabaena sp. FACHB-2040]